MIPLSCWQLRVIKVYVKLCDFDKPKHKILRQFQMPTKSAFCVRSWRKVSFNRNTNRYHAVLLTLVRTCVDEVDWDTAHIKFREIEKANTSGMALATLPYKAGIILALTSAFATVAMIFNSFLMSTQQCLPFA